MMTKIAKNNDEMKEYRCYVNNKLLFKAKGEGQVEIMNTTNRILNYTWPSRKSQDIWPKWQDFARYAVDCRCKKCGRFLCRAVGTDLVIEIKCKHCKHVNTFDIAEMERTRLATLSKRQLDNYNKHKKAFLQ